MELLRRFAHNLPTLILALVLAVTVWVTSVTQADPIVSQFYPRPVPVDIVGQDPGTVLTSENPRQVIVNINAPRNSVWTRLNNETGLVTATVDLSGLGPGTHNVRVGVHVDARPAEVVSVSPPTVSITLERLLTRTLPLHLLTRGEPAVGYQAGDASYSPAEISISGPEGLVSRVAEVRATIDLSQSHENIERTITLQPLDSGENLVTGVTLNPDKIDIKIPISQRYGFRTVSVKAVISGQVASGYRVTNISVFPLAVTVSSSDPQQVNNLPGFVETTPVNIDGAKNDLDVSVPLNLPQGVRVEGDQNVLVQVGITAIESNLTLSNLGIETVGLPPNLAAKFSPPGVDVILSGPLPLLDRLSIVDVHVIADLTDKPPGTYQVTPTVQLDVAELRVVSIMPGTIEVSISIAPTPTATRRP